MRAGRQINERRGFSLLEVILATAILMGALTVLGQLAQLGYRNARAAKLELTAQLLCEAKLAEIVSGIEPVAEVAETPLVEQPGWLHAVIVTPLDQPGLVSVEVTVRQDLAEEKQPRVVRLTRWMQAPTSTEGQSPGGFQSSPDGDRSFEAGFDSFPEVR